MPGITKPFILGTCGRKFPRPVGLGTRDPLRTNLACGHSSHSAVASFGRDPASRLGETPSNAPARTSPEKSQAVEIFLACVFIQPSSNLFLQKFLNKTNRSLLPY